MFHLPCFRIFKKDFLEQNHHGIDAGLRNIGGTGCINVTQRDSWRMKGLQIFAAGCCKDIVTHPV